MSAGAVALAAAALVAGLAREARAEEPEPRAEVKPEPSASEPERPADVTPAPETPSPPATPPASEGPAAPPPAARARPVNVRGVFEVGAYQDSVAVSVLTPSAGVHAENPVAGWSVDGRYLVDMISAASPDIVSTASTRWTETRHAGNVGGRYKPGNYGVGVNAVTSYTPDYLSLGGSASLTQDLDDKNLTLTEGYGFGHDVIGRAGTSFDVFSRKLDYHSFNLGVSRVINPSLVVGVSSDVMVERGDQSKPYRYIPIFRGSEAATIERGASASRVAAMRLQARPLEQLPLARERAALTGRVAWRLGHSTIRLDERGYADSWGLRASTTEVRWLFDVGDRLVLWPRLRFHAQNGVDFWRRAYVGTAEDLPRWRTGDRELGPLLSVGTGVGARLSLGRPGSREDWVLVGLVDGTYTTFGDAIYVKDRWSGLAVVGLEVGF